MSCDTKIKYVDRLAAERALASTLIAQWTGNATRKERRVYDCSHCDGWHLTSQPFQRSRSRRPKHAPHQPPV